MTPAIRPAQPRDVLRLEAIENAADFLLIDRLRPARWELAPSAERRASVTGFILVVSERIDGDAVGFVQVIERDDVAHLEQLSVLPEHGRRGFGRALVEAAKTEANDRGYSAMTLRTYVDIPWNAPFYGTCGFVESEPQSLFHLELVRIEADLGLGRHGRRIQMTVRMKAAAA